MGGTVLGKQLREEQSSNLFYKRGQIRERQRAEEHSQYLIAFIASFLICQNIGPTVGHSKDSHALTHISAHNAHCQPHPDKPFPAPRTASRTTPRTAPGQTLTAPACPFQPPCAHTHIKVVVPVLVKLVAADLKEQSIMHHLGDACRAAGGGVARCTAKTNASQQ